MFKLIVIGITLITACLPLIASFLVRRRYIRKHITNPILPLVAAVLFLISFYLPDIHISPETSTFQQHFVGGGIYSALLYYYIKQLLGYSRLQWLSDAMFLFAWVSSLGVMNKLLEFFLLKAGMMQLDTSDAYWDLVANTEGAFLVFIFARILFVSFPNRKSTFK